MPSFRHLLNNDSPPLAATVIEQNLRQAGAQVTIVLLGGVAASLPAGAEIKRLGPDLDYSALLDLIFESDHVVTW